jgi:ribose transport system ATP-binding protein
MALLSMQGVEKSFAGVKALSAASLEIGLGEVMALIGQNGAGKSTLMKVLSGVPRKDAGRIQLRGRDVEFRSTADSQQAGIATIYQEINLSAQRSVAENIFLGREPLRWGRLDKARMRRESVEALRVFRLDVDVDQPLGRFNAATRQMVAIARAFVMNAKLIIMDEPTSSLDEREVAILFDAIRALKVRGVSVCFIGHRLDELYAICDRVTVMRDGVTVHAGAMADVSKFDLVKLMIGKEPSKIERGSRPTGANVGPARVALENVGSGARVRDVSLAVRVGEICGLAGLLGSGRSETVRALFGAEAMTCGSLRFEGRLRAYRGPADAIADGIGFVSEDRKVDGIVPDLSILENMSLAALPGLTKNGLVDRGRQREIAGRYIRLLGIKCSGPDQPIRQLSGGNQQKVLLARWLCMDTKLLLIDEPTRGIDVGAKAEILKLLRQLADEGMSVLMVSSEIDELMAVADEVTVLSDGCNVATLPLACLEEHVILSAMAQQPQTRQATQIASEGVTA